MSRPWLMVDHEADRRWEAYMRRLRTDGRIPAPPEFLVGALQDRAHVDVGPGRAARTVRNTPRCGRCGAHVDTDCVCP